MTVEDIREYCREVFKKAGYDFDFYKIEVGINNRLTKTLGRCIGQTSHSTGLSYVEKIEISGKLIETAKDEDIIPIIYHECCHALVIIETGEAHGHDATFKKMCQRVGSDNYTRSTQVKRTVDVEKIYKYTVYCKSCGFIAGYTKMCKTIKYLDNCKCGKCKGTNLYYKQNW